MRSILDLDAQPEQGQSPWNKRTQQAEKDAEVSRSVGTLGAKLNDLGGAETRPESERGEPQERNPEMAQESQRTQAAAAGAATSTSARTILSDVPAAASSARQANDSRIDYELVLGRGQIASCLFALIVVVAIFAGGAYFAGKLSAMNCVAASNSIPLPSAPLRVASVVPEASATPAASPQADIPQATISPASAPQPNAAQAAGSAIAAKTVVGPSMATAAAANTNRAAASVQVAAVAASMPGAIASTEAQNSPAAQANTGAGDVKGSPLFANPKQGALYLQMGAVERGMAMVIAEGLRQHGLASFVAPGPTDRIFRVLVGPFTTQEEYKRGKAEVDSLNVGSFARQFEK